MDIRQTDPGGLRQRLSQVLAARPLLRGLLRALGAGGFCFVLAGAGVIIARARRRDIPDVALSAEERQRLAALLKEGKER